MGSIQSAYPSGDRADPTAKPRRESSLLSPGREQEDLRWYLEDYLERAESVETVTVEQVKTLRKTRGEELYRKVLADNSETRALWFSIRDELADLRVEITTGVAEAASIPWELMRDPQLDSPISLRVKMFVRVQANPNIAFVPVPPAHDGRVRVISCMQGLDNLYEYQGRRAEWATLVEEIRPDFCTATDEPIPGREAEYGFVMTYRVTLALNFERAFGTAVSLQEKCVKWYRQRAKAGLPLPVESPLDAAPRSQLRALAVSLGRRKTTLSNHGRERSSFALALMPRQLYVTLSATRDAQPRRNCSHRS